jgi:hypothetical protein
MLCRSQNPFCVVFVAFLLLFHRAIFCHIVFNNSTNMVLPSLRIHYTCTKLFWILTRPSNSVEYWRVTFPENPCKLHPQIPKEWEQSQCTGNNLISARKMANPAEYAPVAVKLRWKVSEMTEICQKLLVVSETLFAFPSKYDEWHEIWKSEAYSNDCEKGEGVQ